MALQSHCDFLNTNGVSPGKWGGDSQAESRDSEDVASASVISIDNRVARSSILRLVEGEVPSFVVVLPIETIVVCVCVFSSSWQA